MFKCSDCKYARQISEHEKVCTADRPDLYAKTCYFPNIDDALIEVYLAISPIVRNSDQLSELLI